MKESHTRKKYETKYNELVQIRLKMSRDIYQSHNKLIKWLNVQTLVLRTPRDNKVLNQDKGHNKKYLQNLQKFVAPKGITHQKLLKLMKAILPKQQHHWRLSQTNLTISICKSKNQLNANTNANKKKPKTKCSSMYAG